MAAAAAGQHQPGPDGGHRVGRVRAPMGEVLDPQARLRALPRWLERGAHPRGAARASPRHGYRPSAVHAPAAETQQRPGSRSPAARSLRCWAGAWPAPEGRWPAISQAQAQRRGAPQEAVRRRWRARLAALAALARSSRRPRAALARPHQRVCGPPRDALRCAHGQDRRAGAPARVDGQAGAARAPLVGAGGDGRHHLAGSEGRALRAGGPLGCRPARLPERRDGGREAHH